MEKVIIMKFTALNHDILGCCACRFVVGDQRLGGCVASFLWVEVFIKETYPLLCCHPSKFPDV
jgi:hypothetical protein